LEKGKKEGQTDRDFIKSYRIMVHYNFKAIATVPSAKDFIDFTLSKTQRKTPTVVHPGYSIGRIRQFYMRKVKFTQQNLHDRFSRILEEFPILDDIHPFYADLMNVLYDRDHYKLALSQMNTARHLVDNIAKDYCKLLKYGDTLYRCKQLKRAAMGRMMTLLKKQNTSLAYLEQVRQHLARLPVVDPSARTLILCGYPNVGKSSFLNKLTRADVEVQPFPFTTKSLFVGHTDYEYLSWQVIDTPGILDRPLEERNTIEMQSITALAHLRAAIIYMVDITESCGYSLKQQVSLFESIKPLFANKPLLFVINKIDVRKMEDLSLDEKKLIESVAQQGATILTMSTFSEEGMAAVKKIACDQLLSLRLETKLGNTKKMSEIQNRLELQYPEDNNHFTSMESSSFNPDRPPIIPDTVFKTKKEKEQFQMMSDSTFQDENGKEEKNDSDEEEEELNEDGEPLPLWLRGFNDQSLKKKYLLKTEEWKFDKVPEFFNGHNVADWVDPEIIQKLEQLEYEENIILKQIEEERLSKNLSESEFELSEEQKSLLKKIREKKKSLQLLHSQKRSLNATTAIKPRSMNKENLSLSKFENHLKDMGIEETDHVTDRRRERSLSRGRKRSRSASQDASKEIISTIKERSASRSKTPFKIGEGFKDVKQKDFALSLAKRALLPLGKEAKKGEGDRSFLNEMPKHLFSGKRKGGKTQRR